MKLISFLAIFISSLYSMSSHPVILMTLILVQTTFLCAIGWMKLKISWFSYILFLIFLGGLMVLFVYITSLASNEKISLNLTNFVAPFMIMLIIISLMINNTQHYDYWVSPHMFKTFNFMYSFNSSVLVLATMVYLLLTLVIVVKISNKLEAPIKSMIFE